MHYFQSIWLTDSDSPAKSMSFEFQTVDPQSVRDEVVNFFWQHRKWPGETREDYYQIWDWRYSSLSEGPALVHIARLRESGEIVGHIGVYRRTFRFGDVTLRVGVPGNLFAHPQWQSTIVGVRLVMFLRSLVQRGEFDAILGFGNEVANRMLANFGFAQLGTMHTYVDVRDVEPLLRRRNPVLTMMAPLINTVTSVRRDLKAPRRAERSTNLEVRQLTPEQILEIDRSHWAPTNRLVAWDSNRFLAQRYLMEPQTSRAVHGLFNPSTDTIEAYVVSDSTTRIKVWDCQVNPITIDPPSAIAAVATASWPNAETIQAPTIPQTRLARDLVAAGFFDRRSEDLTEANTYVSAYWLPTSPHAAVLSDPSSWNIWIGSRHY
jgi:predicted N-acetyltransferase YhbS